MFSSAVFALLICVLIMLSLTVALHAAVWAFVALSYIPHRIGCWRRGERCVPLRDTVRSVWRTMCGNSWE